MPAAGADAEAQIEVELADAVRGADRELRIDGKSFRVKIPAGVSDGSQIRLAGQGEKGQHGGPDGNLYLKVKLREHPHVRREAKDLYLDVPITVPEAALGAEITLPTFEGPVRLTVPEGSQGGRRLRLRGKGLPDLKGGPRGDLYAVLKIVLPEDSPRLKKAAESMKELYKGDPRGGIAL
jgi:curved DNA-binding protein